MALLWNGDFETGSVSQYGNWEWGGASDGTPPLSQRAIVTSGVDGVTPAFGTRFLKVLVSPGDVFFSTTGWRTLGRQHEPIQQRSAGYDSSYVMCVRVPTGYPGDANMWLSGIEMHGPGVGTDGQGLVANHHVIFKSTSVTVDVYGGIPNNNTKTTYVNQQVLSGYAKDAWHVFAFRYKVGAAPNGHYELWHGRLGVDTALTQLISAPSIGTTYDGKGVYPLFFLYRAQSGTGTVTAYFDELREYSTLQEAKDRAVLILTGGGGGGPPPPPPPPPPGATFPNTSLWTPSLVVNASPAAGRGATGTRSLAVARLIYPPGGSVTASGNEITDAVRLAGLLGDGRASPDSSFGIWRATTNLVTNGGFETNTVGWVVGGANTIAASTDRAKFGARSGKITYVDSFRLAQYPITLTAAPHMISAWVYIPAATALSGVGLEVRDFTGGAGNDTLGVTTNLRDQWVRIFVPITPVAGDLVGTVWVHASGITSGVVYVDGVQVEEQPIATPYVETNGGTASRSAARVQAPSTLIERTQCWVALRVRMGFPNTAVPGGNAFPFIWNDNADANNDQLSIYIDGGGTINFRSWDAAAQDIISLSPTWAVGDAKTLIYAVTAAQLKASIDGAAFSTVSRLHVPRAGILAATFNIGSAWNNWQSNLDVLWFACGTGTLTDADAAVIHGFGDTDPDDLPGTPTLLWPANTTSLSSRRVAGLGGGGI